MLHSSSGKAKSHSASDRISCLLWNLKMHYCFDKSSTRPYPDPQAISCSFISTLHLHLQSGLLPVAIPVAYSTYSELPSMPRDTFSIKMWHNGISRDPCNNGLLLQQYKKKKKKSTLKNQNFCTNSFCVLLFPILLWLNYNYYQWLALLWSGNYLHLWCSIVQYTLHNSKSLDTILSKKKSVWGSVNHLIT
jgi:hypothetical protein